MLVIKGESPDGTLGASNVKVTQESDGKEIEGIRSASIWIEAGEPTRVDMTVQLREVDITAESDDITFICPCCHNEINHSCPKR